MMYNFEVRAGNSGTVKNEAGLEIVLKSGDPPLPVDLSDSSFVFSVLRDRGQPLTLEKTSEVGGGILVDADDGRVTVPFTSDDTRAMFGRSSNPLVSVIYQLDRIRPQSERTVLFGSITVLAGVSDD